MADFGDGEDVLGCDGLEGERKGVRHGGLGGWVDGWEMGLRSECVRGKRGGWGWCIANGLIEVVCTN